MFSNISGEFEALEFAEFAVRQIKASIKSPIKISYIHNNRKFKGKLKNNEHDNATHGSVFYLLPTAISSYNYITANVTRQVNTSLISEPLLTKSVTLLVQSDEKDAGLITGIMSSYGGYNIKTK